MRRSWLVWAASTVAFLLTVLIIVATGPISDTPAIGSQSHRQSLFSAKAENAAVERAARNQLVAIGTTRQPATEVGQPAAESSDRADSSGAAASSVAGGTAASDATGKGGGSTADSLSSEVSRSADRSVTSKSAAGYQPKEILRLADPSNYGERFAVDIGGNPVSNDFIVVLHETVGSASSALNLFERHHPRDEDQVSYHTLIGLDGTVYYVVPPEQRAFGAGDSTFRTTTGEETVATNPGFPSSVNNFAYHISLETPPDGQNNNRSRHSGYTQAQYQSLAWLLARTTVPDYRITTHKAVDRSGSRSDPRSYEPNRLFNLLHQYDGRLAYSY